MILNFKKVIIHNFLSYGHAEIDLTDKHYCLVTGQNNALSDNATSNGAGKSSWSSAICWALTGETIQGLSTNIKNINVEENSCYVELIFDADNDHFKICRYKNPKSDLKIELNGNDISGKGIRESQEVLARYLPDLTSQLIASIIILGQGLPNKFTANSPSGRKEVLEKLSKSDFMIQDLKTRVARRSDELALKLRQLDDIILTAKTRSDMAQEAITRTLNLLEELGKPINFDIEIYNTELTISSLSTIIADLEHTAEDLQKSIHENAEVLAKETAAMNCEIAEETKEFDSFKSEYMRMRSELMANIKSLDTYINNIKNIVDICPTCHQKIPNITKPNADNEIAKRAAYINELNNLEARFKSVEAEYLAVMQGIRDKHSEATTQVSSLNSSLNESLKNTSSEQAINRKKLTDAQINLTRLNTEKSERLNRIKAYESELASYKNDLDYQNQQIIENTKAREEILAHIQVVNQMSTLLKRDFRGYLLSEIINYIGQKGKQYCEDIFGNDLIEFALDGNNINISYAGKAFENLSGGEKQRIDLIIQFAIRSMMEKYLNFSSNILVLDEIFDQLDSVGCEAILEFISKRLLDVESIFIISHRADELEIPCDYQLNVLKDRQGVTTIQWQ